jgi:hypothetical protein
MKDNIVQIRGNKYRYRYDPVSKKTHYVGPVASSPELTEDDFQKLLLASRGEEIYEMTIEEGRSQWVANFKPDGRQLYETRLVILDYRVWGDSPSQIMTMVEKAGYKVPEQFTIAPTNGEWEFIVKEWKVRRF